jgi:hypothetical protein
MYGFFVDPINKIVYDIGMMHKSDLGYISTLYGLNYTLEDFKYAANQFSELIGFMTYLGIDHVNIMDVTGISVIFLSCK